MNTLPLVFMLSAWICVLGLTTWCFARLVKVDPSKEKVPPPGTSL